MSKLYFENRSLLALTILLTVVAGLVAWQALPRREDPEITSRWAVVFTRFPGATAERVEALVTEKIEDELREIEEIREVTSSSRAGISILQIELMDEVTEADTIWSRVRDKLDDAAALMPAGAQPPEFEEFTIDAYTTILGLVWLDDSEPNHAVLRRLAENLEDELRAVPGTKETDLFGHSPEEIIVEADAEQLALRGLTAADVARAVRRSDAKVAAGQLHSAKSNLVIEVQGELDSLDSVRRIPLRYGEGDQVVRLGDVARVRKTIADPPRALALVDGRDAVVVAARMESGRRVDHWSETVRDRLKGFRAALPGGIGLRVLFDQSRYTNSRLYDLMGNLGIGAVLVIGVVLFMMGWRSALLVGAALPLASLMVLTGMKLLGVPLHQMSVTGLIIALGLLIDSAIVMVDEVRHRRKEGQAAGAAVSGAVRKMAVPLLSSTATTAFAFMPLLLAVGPVGDFVGPMALTVILAISSSLFLALTVIPALAGMFDRITERKEFWRNGFSSPGLLRAYRATLGFLFRRPIVVVGLALILPFFGFAKGLELEQQFFPPAGRDQFPVDLRMPAQASIAQTREYAIQARQLLLRHPQVSDVHWFVGESAPKFYYNMIEGEDNTPSYAQALVQLRSGEGSTEVIRTLQAWLDGALREGQFIAKQLEQGPPFDAPIEIHLYGADLDRLRDLGERIRLEMSQVESVTHSRALLTHGRPKLWVRTDEEEANLAGLDRVGIARQLDAHLVGAVGGSMLEATEELPVRVRVGDASRGDVDRIASLELVAEPGVWTPLNAVGRLELHPELSDLPHRNGLRVNTIQGYLQAGTLPEDAFNEIYARIAPILEGLPAGFDYEVGGEHAERKHAEGRLFESMGVLVMLMMATLVLGFGSFRLAGVIGFVAFLCAGLSMGALWLFGYPFGFMAIVGTMGLVGIAINDSIVVLAAVRDDERAAGGDPEAMQEVIVRSTRHVFATTLTTAGGFLPLILAGGGFWPPLAVAIAGGVTGATLLALYFVPAVYLMLNSKKVADPVVAAVPAPAPA